MKKWIFGAVVLSLCWSAYGNAQAVPPAKAKEPITYLVGASGGADFGNIYFGPTAGIEIPLGKHFEIDAYEQYSPFQWHVALGKGFANEASVDGIYWFRPTVGLIGEYSNSYYDAFRVSKDYHYVAGGLAWTHKVLGIPSFLSFEYLQEIHNGIAPDGTETDHIKGGAITWEFNLYCSQKTCLRLTEQVNAGRVLTQGNQYCDGSIGPKLAGCDRGVVIGGGVETSVVFEFGHGRP